MQAIVALEVFKKPAELGSVEMISQEIPKISFGETRKIQRLKVCHEIQFLKRLWGVNWIGLN